MPQLWMEKKFYKSKRKKALVEVTNKVITCFLVAHHRSGKYLLFSSSKRTSLQIQSDMLTLCRKPQPKTRIMLKTNLSYKTCKKYLNRMVRLKLIEVHHSREKFLTTEKGQEYLELCLELQRLFKTDENPKRSNPDPSLLMRYV